MGYDIDGICCLIFEEDAKTKTNQGGLDHHEIQPRTTYIYENLNKAHCPICLFEKYCTLLPESGEKPDFYMYPLTKPMLTQWYSDHPIGINTLHCTMKRLVDSAGLEGKFSNHSLHTSNATHLYQAGCPEKLIKEVTRHRSDEVHKYQRMPNSLKRAVSETLSKALSEFKVPKVKEPEKKDPAVAGQMTLDDCIKVAGTMELSEIMKGVDKSHVKKVSVQIDVEYHDNK